MLGHIVLGVMRNQEFILNMFHIGNKRGPGFLKLRLLTFSLTIVILIMIELSQFIILRLVNAGNGDGINAVVDMVDALLGCIFLLNSPHLPEIGCGNTLDNIDLLENRLEEHARIAGYDTDIRALTARKALGHFRHCEPLIFSSPVIAFKRQQVPATDDAIFFFFCRCPAAFEFADSLAQVFSALIPVFNALQHLFMIGQF